MKKYILTVVILIAAGVLSAQNKAMTDTVYSIKEVEVVDFSRKKVSIGKFNVPLRYLPVSVNTVSAKLLESRGIVNLEDAVKFFPGVRMNTSYGSFNTLYIRGFSNAPVLLDGVRDERTMINSNPFSDLSSVESMEMLKGPGSVLYGHSVVGGALNIVRKAPTDQKLARFKMSYGSWENKQATMDLGGKLAGPVNYRAVVNYADQEGWRHNGNQRLSAYMALGAKLDATSNIDIRGGFNRDFYGTEIGLPPNMSYDTYNLDGTLYLKAGEMQPGLNRKVRYNNESDFFKNNGWNIAAKYEKKINENFKLQNNISFNFDDINYFGTEELSYLESLDPIYNNYYLTKDKNGNDIKNYISLDTVQLTYPLRFSHKTNVLNDQLDLSGKFFTGNIKHNFIAGYAFTQMFRNSYSGYNLAPMDDSMNSSYNVYGPGLYSKVAVNDLQSGGYMKSNFGKATITRTYSHGIYFQDLMEVTDKLKVLVAGRYDFFKYLSSSAPTYDGKRQYHKADQTAYNVNNTSSFTYRAGVVYDATKDLTVYGSMASFFMPYRDFYNEKVIYVNSDGKRFYPEKGGEIFKPQTGYQGEVGARYAYKTWLQATASAFYIKRNNDKRTKSNVKDTDGVLKTVTAQVGTTVSQGVELEVKLTPVRNLFFQLQYGYTDAKVSKMKANEYIEVDPQKDYKLTLVPANTFLAAVDYTIGAGVFKNLGFNATVSYMDKTYRNTTNTMTYPSYWLTDCGVSYRMNNGVTLSANVNNIFDKKYYNQSLSYQMVPSMPRNVLVSLAYTLR